jgi:hypothetical protein
MPARVSAHLATTGKLLTDAQDVLPNLQRIAAPFAISNQLSRFEFHLRFFVQSEEGDACEEPGRFWHRVFLRSY